MVSSKRLSKPRVKPLRRGAGAAEPCPGLSQIGATSAGLVGLMTTGPSLFPAASRPMMLATRTSSPADDVPPS
jgi:hypothetical protein